MVTVLMSILLFISDVLQLAESHPTEPHDISVLIWTWILRRIIFTQAIGACYYRDCSWVEGVADLRF